MQTLVKRNRDAAGSLLSEPEDLDELALNDRPAGVPSADEPSESEGEKTTYFDGLDVDLTKEVFLLPWLEQHMLGRRLFDLVR